MKKCTPIIVTVITIALVLIVVGIIVICSATSIGNTAGIAAIRQAGGSMDTNNHLFIKETVAESCQIIGALCTAIGGYAAVKFGCLWFKQKPEQN